MPASSKCNDGTRQERARLLAAKAKALDPVEEVKDDSVIYIYRHCVLCVNVTFNRAPR